jgi:SAM-dependent methyltransferase
MPENFSMESLGVPVGGVSDPAFWNSRYLKRDTPWDKGRAHPALEAWFLNERPTSGSALVPGCGSGEDARFAARFLEKVVGLDFAENAVELARNHPANPPNLVFHQGDFFRPSLVHRESFDYILEHTCFCAIAPERRITYIKTASSYLRPRGFLIGIFFLEPENDGEGPPFGISKEDLRQTVETEFTIEHERIPEQTFAEREGRELLVILRKKV